MSMDENKQCINQLRDEVRQVIDYAHDINNPLYLLFGTPQYIQKDYILPDQYCYYDIFENTNCKVFNKLRNERLAILVGFDYNNKQFLNSKDIILPDKVFFDDCFIPVIGIATCEGRHDPGEQICTTGNVPKCKRLTIKYPYYIVDYNFSFWDDLSEITNLSKVQLSKMFFPNNAKILTTNDKNVDDLWTFFLTKHGQNIYLHGQSYWLNTLVVHLDVYVCKDSYGSYVIKSDKDLLENSFTGLRVSENSKTLFSEDLQDAYESRQAITVIGRRVGESFEIYRIININHNDEDNSENLIEDDD